MSAKFKQVVGLNISPDFSGITASRSPLPRVNHNLFNPLPLIEWLEQECYCGENVKIRMADDTIDQVTLHFRISGPNPEDAYCQDFASGLFDAAKGAKPVIPVRAAWAKLHVLPDRTQAPPPSLLMFVVEGSFESVQIWTQQFCMRCGVRAASMDVLLSGSASADDYQGTLPAGLRALLRETFGVPYLQHCLVSRTKAHSALPAWAKNPF